MTGCREIQRYSFFKHFKFATINGLTMPPVLTKAHAALDSAVDKLYRKAAFPDDAAHVAFC